MAPDSPTRVPEEPDLFGYSVALAGDAALIGAVNDEIGMNGDEGSVYVFTRSGPVWSEQSKLTQGDGAAIDWFGHSVALSGDTALVGVPLDDSTGPFGDRDVGSVYLYDQIVGLFAHFGDRDRSFRSIVTGDC